ncbi:MAG TPA: radical SAM protein [Ktedonobacteraceae bacterium]|jgi:radical SAM protein with 4Fe4S-binding SPASM domain|nr:radical SAM protein [Ktedonobacteraceae bacterium]
MELPTYVQIEPVGQCNLRCQMCAIQFRHDGPPYGPLAFMEFEHFTRILDQLGPLKELHLQGLGEPMMHPRFFDMIVYATQKGMQVTTNSNLTLLNDRRAEGCVTSGLYRLHISIDGASAETYERIRARAHFDRVMRNLERLVTVRERLGSRLPELVMVVVIMRQNLHELPELVRLAHRWSFSRVFVQHLCHDFGESSLPSYYRPMREFVSEQTLLHEDSALVSRYFDEARQIAKDLEVELRLPRTTPRLHPAGTPGKERCSWPWQGAYISYQGYAMPCCMVSTPDRIHFGSVLEQGVRATWENEQYQAFRDQLASDTPPEICRSCSLYAGVF